MEEHELHMIVKFRSEPGWKAANEVALMIGSKVLQMSDNILEVDGSIDPDITDGRVKVHRIHED